MIRWTSAGRIVNYETTLHTVFYYRPPLDLHSRSSPLTDPRHALSALHTMATDLSEHSKCLPGEMLKFILDSNHRLLQASRLGQLLTQGRAPIQTPHFVAASSRGVVPHLAHDVLRKHTNISAVYMGLEDCEFYHTSAPSQRADYD